MIEIRRADSVGVCDTAAEMAILGTPFLPGVPAEIEAKVVAVAADGRFARWACKWMGRADDDIPLTQDAGDVVPWTCRIDRRPGELALVVAGEDGVPIQWRMDGWVLIYA